MEIYTGEGEKILKTKNTLHLQCNVVYKIPCSDCSWSYVGETGRCFKTRRKEHQHHLKNCTRGSNIANHAWQNNHSINFEGATVIDKGNYRVRRTLLLAYCQNCQRRQ